MGDCAHDKVAKEEWLLQQSRGKEWKARQNVKTKVAKQCFTCGGPHYARHCAETVCHYCGKIGHLARDCSFGTSLHPYDQFVFCRSGMANVSACDADSNRSAGWQIGPDVGCFVRCFIMPLHLATTSFDLSAPLCEGRLDIGCRAVAAALFRSEAYRRHTEMRLSFCGSLRADKTRSRSADADIERDTHGQTDEIHSSPQSGISVVLTGGLIRGLQAHEHAIASRLRVALDSAATGVAAPGSLRTLQGLRCVHGGLDACVVDALRFCRVGSAVLLLTYDGMPIYSAMQLLHSKLSEKNDDVSRPQQVTVILGDHMGISVSEEEGIHRAVHQAGAELIRVCLGPTTLLGSHCITICHHYMDSFLHCCPEKLFEVHPNVAKMRKQYQGKDRATRRHDRPMHALGTELH